MRVSLHQCISLLQTGGLSHKESIFLSDPVSGGKSFCKILAGNNIPCDFSAKNLRNGKNIFHLAHACLMFTSDGQPDLSWQSDSGIWLPAIVSMNLEELKAYLQNG